MNENLLEAKEESIQISELILRILEIVVKRRWYIIAVMVAVNIVTLTKLLFFSPAYYASSVTILPQAAESVNPLSLAAKSLFSVAGTTVPTENTLYKEILTSRKIIYRILERKFPSEDQDREMTLLSILEIDEPNKNKRMQKGYKVLTKDLIDVSSDLKNITTVKVESKYRTLSPLIAKALVEELDSYNKNINTQKARENRVFIEERLEEIKVFLKNAEDDLKIFRENNKRIEKSPQLQLESGRLQRELLVQEEVFLTLRKEYEVVKIEEVKNLSMLRILDEPMIPIDKSRPMRTRAMLLSIIVSFGAGIALAFGIEFSDEFASDQDQVSRLRKLRSYFEQDYKDFKRKTSRFSGNDSDEEIRENISINNEDDLNT